MDELDLERSDLHDLLGLDLDEARLLLQFVFFQAAVHQRQRESGAVDRDIDFGEEIGDRADVVFVAVGQDDGADLGLVLLEEGQVGHHQVDAQQLGFGEHHPAIDHDDVVAETYGGHVHAELAQSAQGDYL